VAALEGPRTGLYAHEKESISIGLLVSPTRAHTFVVAADGVRRIAPSRTRKKKIGRLTLRSGIGSDRPDDVRSLWYR
jgi:hypothetical protein